MPRTRRSQRSPGRGRSRRAEPEINPLDRAFALVASPWALGGALMLLALVTLVDAYKLDHGGVLWSTEPARAIVLALVVLTALAVGAVRLLPLLSGSGGRTAREGVEADLRFRPSQVSPDLLRRLDRSDSWFHGKAAAAGLVALFVGLVIFAGWPLFQPRQLGLGGDLALDVGEKAEAATVVVEGVPSRSHLGGVRYQLMSFDPGRTSAGGSGVAQATLQMTEVATGNLYEASVWEGAPTWLGPYKIHLAGSSPSERVSGVAVTITEVASGRKFDADLMAGVAFKDPAGPGTFQLRRIAESFADGQGLAAQGTVSVGGSTSEFWVYADSAAFDKLHRKGAYAVQYRGLIRGNRVTFHLAPEEPNNPVPFAIVAMLAGFLLLFTTPALTVVLRTSESGVDEVAVASLNSGESLVSLIETGALLAPDEDYDDDDEEEAG